MALSVALLLACATARGPDAPPTADVTDVAAGEVREKVEGDGEDAGGEEVEVEGGGEGSAGADGEGNVGAEAPGPRVEAWAMNLGPPGRPECLWAVDEDGAACRSVGVGPVALDNAQAARLEAWLADPATFGEPLSGCFIPHHAFTWRDADGIVQRQVSVCVSCDNLRATGPVAGLPEDPGGQGFSAAGRADFQALCRELGLPVCEGVVY